MRKYGIYFGLTVKQCVDLNKDKLNMVCFALDILIFEFFTNILGIIREAILHIFDAIEQETDKQFLLRVSYMEIYNEEVKDLLASKNGEKRRKSQALKVLDDSDGSVNIIGNTNYRNSYTMYQVPSFK